MGGSVGGHSRRSNTESRGGIWRTRQRQWMDRDNATAHRRRPEVLPPPFVTRHGAGVSYGGKWKIFIDPGSKGGRGVQSLVLACCRRQAEQNTTPHHVYHLQDAEPRVAFWIEKLILTPRAVQSTWQRFRQHPTQCPCSTRPLLKVLAARPYSATATGPPGLISDHFSRPRAVPVAVLTVRSQPAAWPEGTPRQR
jgi:hypothetical protein